MSYLFRGQANSPTSPALDIYTTVGSSLVDAHTLDFQIFDISTDLKRSAYYTGNRDSVQLFPDIPGTRYGLNTTHLYTDSTPGHKLSTGHYYAPWTTPLTVSFGNYLIAWYFKSAEGAAERTFEEEFVIIAEDVLTGQSPLVDKMRFFLMDFFQKNQLIDSLEYTPDNYMMALDMALMRFNVMTPMTEWMVTNFPYQATYLLLIGGVGHLLRATSHEQLRNQLTYTDGNVHVGITDKHQLYLNAGSTYMAEFDQMGRAVKNQMNNDAAWGDSMSPIVGWLPGDGGWGSI